MRLKSLLFAASFALVTLPGSMAPAALSCPAIFAAPVELGVAAAAADAEVIYGSLKPSFKHNTHYTVEVSEQSLVKDQCQLGTCHLQSWASLMEQDHEASTNKVLRISTKYLAAHRWLSRSLEELLKDVSNVGGDGSRLKVTIGANAMASRELILKVGVIPDDVWQPKADFQSAPLSARMADYIENIIGRARIERKTHPNEMNMINAEARKAIENIFLNVVGPLPESFTFENRVVDPVSFLKEQFPSFTKPIVRITLANNGAGPTTLARSVDQVDVSTTLVAMEKTIRQVIDSGHNVWLGYQHDPQYVDKATGLMSIGAFNVPEGAGPLGRRDRATFDKDAGGHAVQIVGYELDRYSGQVVKWKIKNSWGVKLGSEGYFHMYADYFRTFANMVAFYDNPAIRLPRP